MASISSTSSSLGNTSLRGYGGMASGIDRDAIIEQMTAGTNTKITNAESDITKLEWKQEAYRGISDKILDLYDNYCSYTSTTSLKDPNTFAKSLISVIGKDDVTKFISATGSSDLVSSVSVKAVKQIATSTVRQSEGRVGELEMKLEDLDGTFMYTSNLVGAQLRFVSKNGDGTTADLQVLPMPSTYYEVDENGDFKEDENGNKITKNINYFLEDVEETVDGETVTRKETAEEYGARLEEELNLALSQSEVLLKINGQDVKIGKRLEFSFDNGKMQLREKDGGLGGVYELQTSSTALKGLGYTGTGSDTITIDEFNSGVTGNFQDAALSQMSALDYLKGEKLTFDYDGNKKEIELITAEEAEALKKITGSELSDDDKVQLRESARSEVERKKADELEQEIRDANPNMTDNEVIAKVVEKLNSAEVKDEMEAETETLYQEKLEEASTGTKSQQQLQQIAENVQERLDRAFGKGMVTARINEEGNLAFSTKEDTSTISVSSNDGGVLYNLGIVNGASNKVNVNGKLSQSSIGIDLNEKNADGTQKYADGLVINGVKIDGIDANTTISSILSKINANENVGVKATYVDATGQFMLVSTETGAEREIALDSELARELFGQKSNGTYEPELGVTNGQDAIVTVSYGNGVDIDIKRASNTFNLEGLSVTVSGTFGGEYVGDEWVYDTSETVSFSAKADVDKVVEKVKKFFEDFNAIVTEVNTQVTTRPDSSYGPLTDEQKEEMSETSIENWEKKAKSGLLFNDSTMRDLSMDIQSVYTTLMRQTGLSYEDLKELGITYSDNEKDGGILVFDESAFRTAMESKPDKVSSLFTGGNGMGDGLIKLVEDTFTPYATRYATRNGNSYGRLIEEAGSEKIPTSLMKNQIYNEIKSKQELIESLQAKLKTEQDRYISMFTTMETMINQMNSQASYLSQITG